MRYFLRYFLVILILGGFLCRRVGSDIGGVAPYILKLSSTTATNYNYNACENVKRALRALHSENNRTSDQPEAEQRDSSDKGCKARLAPCLTYNALMAAATLTDSIYLYFFDDASVDFFAGHWKMEMQTIREHFNEMLNALGDWSEYQLQQRGEDEAPISGKDFLLGKEHVNTEHACRWLLFALLPVFEHGAKLLVQATAVVHRFGEIRPLDTAAAAVGGPHATLKVAPEPGVETDVILVPESGMGEIDDMVMASFTAVIARVRELHRCISNPGNVLCTDLEVEEQSEMVDLEFEDLRDTAFFPDLHFRVGIPPLPKTSRTQQEKKQLIDIVRRVPKVAERWRICFPREMPEMFACSDDSKDHFRGQVAALLIGIAQHSIQSNSAAPSQQVGTKAGAAGAFNLSAAVETLSNLAHEANVKSAASRQLEATGKVEELLTWQAQQPQWIHVERLQMVEIATEVVLLLVLCGACSGLISCRGMWRCSSERCDSLHDMLLPVDDISTHSEPPQSKLLFGHIGRPSHFTAFIASVGLLCLVFQLLWRDGGGRRQPPAERGESSAFYAYWAMFASIASSHMNMTDGDTANNTHPLHNLVPELLERIALVTPA